MKTLNIRLLAILLVCVLVFGSVVFVVHAFQIRRNAHVFLREAERAEERGEPIEALRNLGWYVRLVPSDTDALEKFGLQLAELSQYSQAFNVLEAVLRQDPTRSEARREVVDVAIAIRRFTDARAHLEEYLLKDSPNDGELLELLGRCQVALGENRAAAKTFEKAIKNAPDRLEAYPRLAGVLRSRLDRKAEADQWMEKLVEANPKSYRAYLLTGTYLRSIDKTDEAMKHALKALELEPEDRDAIWLAARCALDQEDFDKARDYARSGIKLHPEHVPMYTTLADVELRDGSREKALAALREGLETTSEHPQLLWSTGNLLIDDRQIDQAQEVIEKLDAAEYPDALVGYLQARIEFVQGHWLAAKQGFRRVRGVLTAWPDLVKQADFWTGRCCGQLGNPDEQIKAYRRAIDVDKFFAPARAGLAEAMLSAGDVDGAETEFKQLIRMGRAAARGWISLARIMILGNLRRDPPQRDWRQVEKVLDQAEKATPDSFHIPILRAEVLIAQDRAEDAEKLVQDARDKDPENVELWSVLATLAQRQKDWDLAEKIIEQAQQKLGDKVELRLARARYLVRRYGKDATDRLKKLTEKTEQFSVEDRTRLWKGLLGAALQAGDSEQAKRLCAQVAAEEPNNVRAQFLLFELALRDEDDAEMQRVLEQLQKIEGRGPFWLYGEAVRLTLLAKNGKDELLDRALRHLREAGDRRPSWSRAPLLVAGIYDQQGKPARALKFYLKAIDMGETNPGAIRRVVQLLYRQQRYAEADQMLRRLATVPPELLQRASELSLRQGDFERALEMARSAAADSDDYRDHIWLGQILSITGRRAKAQQQVPESTQLLEEAEQALRKAVELNGRIAATWVALIQFLSGTEQTAKAEQAIAEAQTKIPAEQAPIALAQCYEATGQLKQAQEKYEAALSADPNDLVVVRYVANFYLRTGKPKPAEALLKRIIEGKVKAEESDMAWARRRLALIFSARGGYQNLQKAIDLIEQNLAAAGSSAPDQRALAGFLARHPTRTQRQQAIRALEDLLKGQRLAPPEDQFVLAQLYLAEGAWVKASAQFRGLLASHGNNSRFVAVYANALLSRNEFGGAELWLARLEKLAPQSFATTSLRAELLFRRKQYDQVFELLKGFVEKPAAQPDNRTTRLRLVAASLEQLAGRLNSADRKAAAAKFTAEAETLYRRYVVDRPEEKLRLAAFLGREGKTEEALNLVEQVWDQSNPIPLAQTCVILLKNSNATKDQVQRAEKIVRGALKKTDRAVPLLLVMADVRTSKERYKDAEKFYREIIKKNRGNAVAMNNLAVLLALQGTKLNEAMKLICRAIEIAGPVASMLDSRASVHMALGHPDEALKDLQQAINEADTPIRLFHQAQAYEQAGQQAAAAEAIRKADKLGLKAETLQPLERPAYHKLKALLPAS